MSKDDKIAEGRSQGLLTAYRIAKQAAEEGKDPVEAEVKDSLLPTELQSRQRKRGRIQSRRSRRN